MTVLGIDTTGAEGSLALLRDGEVVEQTLIHAADGFGHLVFGEIQSLLERNCVTLKEIDVFAAAAGPGSFTGVRVGLTVAKGLAAALGRQAAGVSTLAALASLGEGALRAPLLDARRGEIFGAVYSDSGEAVLAEVACKLTGFLTRVPAGTAFVLTGPGPLEAELPAEAKCVYTGSALAAAVARLARPVDPALLDANYVRRADADLKWVDTR